MPEAFAGNLSGCQIEALGRCSFIGDLYVAPLLSLGSAHFDSKMDAPTAPSLGQTSTLGNDFSHSGSWFSSLKDSVTLHRFSP